MQSYELKIPKKRVAVLVGKRGVDKRKLERDTECRIQVNSEGEVLIEGDSLKSYDCSNVVKAIGRGCKPNIALSLLKEENCCEIIEFSGHHL